MLKLGFNLLKPILWLTLLLMLFKLSVHAIETTPTHNSKQGIKRYSLVNRVEPPFWWVGMESRNLQLMMHGKNISQLQVDTSNKQWKIKSVERTDNVNYLFINLMIPKDSPKGIYDLQLVTNGEVIHNIPFELKERKSGSKLRKGFDASDAIYLITPDRFANGDYNNDEVEGLQDKLNRNDENGRHGGDIKGIIEHLDYIRETGFTQIWINPLLENNQKQFSYHGYSTTDYYKIDSRFGNNLLYKQLTQKAKRKGLGIIKDVILNHIGSEHWWMTDLPSKDWINNDAQFKSTSHRRETLQDPYATLEDQNEFTQGWFVPTMPDLNQNNHLLASYLIQNNIWWIEYADLTGIRVDTLSYSNKKFLTEYVERIMREYPKFNIVGEEWSVSPNIVSYWQKGKNRHDNYRIELPSLMDFPLNDAVIKGLTEKEDWAGGLRKIYELLAVDHVYPKPNDLVIFPDNHDMSRIYTQLNHDIDLTKMVFAFYATIRGIPQFYYGSEILMKNPGTESHGVIRTDFVGGWKDDAQNAFSGRKLSSEQKSMQEYVRKLLNWRKQTKVIHNGKLTHYAPRKGIYVYFRYNETGSNKVMVIMNKNNSESIIDPNNYSSMLSTIEKKAGALDVIRKHEYSLVKPFSIASKSVLILQLH